MKALGLFIAGLAVAAGLGQMWWWALVDMDPDIGVSWVVTDMVVFMAGVGLMCWDDLR